MVTLAARLVGRPADLQANRAFLLLAFMRQAQLERGRSLVTRHLSESVSSRMAATNRLTAVSQPVRRRCLDHAKIDRLQSGLHGAAVSGPFGLRAREVGVRDTLDELGFGVGQVPARRWSASVVRRTDAPRSFPMTATLVARPSPTWRKSFATAVSDTKNA